MTVLLCPSPKPFRRPIQLSALLSFCAVTACYDSTPTPYSPTGNGSGGSSGSSGGAIGASGGSLGTGTGGASGGSTSSGGNNAGTGGGSDNSGGSSSGAGGQSATSATFRIQNGNLYSPCGEQVVLRGVNEMIVWTDGKDGDPEFSEIAKTGANVVRIVWNTEGNAAELDTAISGAITAGLIPMIENHDATGDLSKLPAAVDYWLTPDVIAVIKKHERHLLLNIANESGDSNVTDAAFQAAYEAEIPRLRATGITLPLVIDAPGWGQDIDVLQATWQALTAVDPESNLLFSVHMWWHDPDGARVKTELAESVAAEMPLIVGEFAHQTPSDCSLSPFAYSVLLDEAQRLKIGWLVWSWGSAENMDCKEDGPFDMTTDGINGNWSASWAEEIAVTHAASIKNSSVRPASLSSETCP